MAPELRWGRRTYVMGIVNVTPDSFSGDGLVRDARSDDAVVEAAVDRARRFVADGAEIVDVGAESSRPRSAYGDHPDVDPETEAARAIPVVRAIADAVGDRAHVSIDTSKGDVARQAVAAGATMINDVWAARRDPGTATAAAESGTHLVLMHNRADEEGPPGDVVAGVVAWLREAIDRAVRIGVARERILVDPGIGFGKGTATNLALLHRLGELKAELGGLPMVVGTSRKRFLGELLGGADADDRVDGTAATVALAIAAGADVVRVHDVRAMARVRTVADAIVRR